MCQLRECPRLTLRSTVLIPKTLYLYWASFTSKAKYVCMTKTRTACAARWLQVRYLVNACNVCKWSGQPSWWPLVEIHQASLSWELLHWEMCIKQSEYSFPASQGSVLHKYGIVLRLIQYRRDERFRYMVTCPRSSRACDKSDDVDTERHFRRGHGIVS